MKKVTILSLHLGYGGVERSIVSLANAMCKKYKVEIVCDYKLNNKPSFEVDKNVKIVYLMKEKPNKEELKSAIKHKNVFSLLKNIFYSIKVLYKRKHEMKKYIKKCDSDILISSRYLFNGLLKYNKRISNLKIGWEHNHHNNDKKYYKKIIKSCKNLDYLVCVSKELQKFYSNKMKNSNCKVCYIPNIVEEFKTKSLLKNKELISIGRLSPEKGFVSLIYIFNELHKKYPDWNLNIIGDGAEREKLEHEIHKLGLESSVFLLGYKDHNYIEKKLSEQSIYLMTSYTESFGIVLIEAMSVGLPCISFTSAQGANEIIKNGKNGYLINNRDEKQFILKLENLINNYDLRKKMSNDAINTSKEFSKDIVLDYWIKLINNNKKIKTIFISSTGGHLSELLQLEKIFDRYNSYIVTEKTKSNLFLEKKYNGRVKFLVYCTKARFFSYLYKFPYNCIKSLFLFIKINPKIIITTGAHTAVPMCYIAKLFKRKVIFIETLANIQTRTLSGRLVYPIADLFIVQWENMLKLYPKAVLGGVIRK